jgi:putative transposase
VWTWQGLVTFYTVFVIELASRRVQILGSTPHPDEAFMCQIVRNLTLADAGGCRVLICDRDAKWSETVRARLRDAGLRVIRTPYRAPNANAYCERLIGTIRRQCVDLMVPLNERHLRRILAEWVPHYNRGRPHASLGPGIPDRPSSVAPPSTGHRLPHGHRVAATPILGGLHHEYRLEVAAA